VWEFFRNDVLDARNMFATTRPAYRQNQYGGTFGGPILRDKLFFFTSYEGFRIRQGVSRETTVPTALERVGDFSQSTLYGAANVYDPFALDATGQRVRFDGGRIPASRIHPGASKVLQYFPLPNVSGFPNYRVFPSQTDDNDKYMARVDYRKSDKDSFFARYAWETQPRYVPVALPLQGTFFNPNHGHSVNAAWSRILSPRLVNEFRGGTARRIALQDPEHRGVNYNAQLGYSNGATLQQPLWGFPGINVSGYGSMGGLWFDVPSWNLQFSDTLSWTRGSHSLKFGYSYTWTTEARNFNSLGAASHTFSGFYTGPLNAARTDSSIGQPFADFLLGVSNTSGGLTSDEPGLFNPRRQLHHFFVQDTWQLGSKVTVNVGLRYELNLPAYFGNGRGAAYIEELPAGQCTQFLTLGGQQRCRDIVMVYPKNAKEPISNLLKGQTYAFPHRFLDSNYLFDKDLNNVAPRLGIAWRPTRRTVVRTGYGIFFDIGLSNLFTNMGLSAPFFVTNNTSFNRAQVPTGRPGNEFGLVPPNPTQFPINLAPADGGFIEAKWAEKDYVDGYAQSWNLHVQQLFGKAFSVQVGYVGNKTTHYPTGYSINRARPLAGNQQANRPWPRLFSCDCFHSFGAGTYHSLQAEVEQRFSAGLAFRAGYTFGRSINDYRWVQDEFSRLEAKALADFDRRQVSYATAVYDLPFGRSASGAARAILQGWQVGALVSLQGGGRFQAALSADRANTGSRRVLLPNRAGNGNLEESARTVDRFFDTGAFVLQGALQYGNAGYALLEGDGIANADLVLTKRWALAEEREVQFRTEFFNAFNHPTWGVPGANVDAGGYGRVTSASQARQIQFGLKIAF
jgi:hypothetical protein